MRKHSPQARQALFRGAVTPLTTTSKGYSFFLHHTQVSSRPPTRVGGANAIGRWVGIDFHGHSVESFVPHPLPPKFVNLNARSSDTGRPLRTVVEEANKNLEVLGKKLNRLESVAGVVISYMKSEAVLSNNIEENSRSLQDVLLAESGYQVAKNKAEEVELEDIFHSIQALKVGLEHESLRGELLNMEVLEEIHATMMKNNPRAGPGKIRTTQNFLGAAGIPINRCFFPPPPEHVESLLWNCMEFINDTEEDFPFVVRMGVAHAQFETIHPFLDGNGRVGRIIMVLQLIRQYNSVAMLALHPSYAFKAFRAMYFDGLRSVRDTGRWEGYLHEFSTIINYAALDAAELADGIIALHERQTRLLKQAVRQNQAVAAQALLHHLYEVSMVDKDSALKLLGDKGTVDELLSLFVRVGILKQKEDGWFVHEDLLRTFDTERVISREQKKRIELEHKLLELAKLP